MSRYFMIQSWVGSHENEPDYNGQQCGERSVRSSEVVPLYDQYGNANITAFSDEALTKRSGKSSVKIPLKDRILPQAKRIQTLTSQLIELEQAYKSGEYDINEYSLLRNVVARKRERAQILYEKAIAVKESPYQDNENEEYTLENNELLSVFSYEISVDVNTNRVGWFRLFCDSVNDLSADNILKPMLKKTCIVIQKALELSQAVRKYTNEV